MDIFVDDQPWRSAGADSSTVGSVLDAIKQLHQDRLIVELLVDGVAPDISQAWNQSANGRTIFIRTADRRQLAIDALNEARQAVDHSDANRTEALEHLLIGQANRAMPPLARWLDLWQQVPRALIEATRAVNISVDDDATAPVAIPQLISDLAEQLRQIQSALQSRDYVTLSDILRYEAPASINQWQQVLNYYLDKIAAG